MKLIFCVLVRCKWKSVQWMERTDQMTFFIPQCIRSMDSDLIWNSINIRRIHQIRLKKWSSWQRNNRLCKWGGWKAFQSGRNWHILSPGGWGRGDVFIGRRLPWQPTRQSADGWMNRWILAPKSASRWKTEFRNSWSGQSSEKIRVPDDSLTQRHLAAVSLSDSLCGAVAGSRNRPPRTPFKFELISPFNSIKFNVIRHHSTVFWMIYLKFFLGDLHVMRLSTRNSGRKMSLTAIWHQLRHCPSDTPFICGREQKANVNYDTFRSQSKLIFN